MSKILMSAQVDACERCASAARAALRDLCEAVYVDRLDAALAAVACCEIGGAALDHAEAAARRGWGLPNAGARIALPGLAPVSKKPRENPGFFDFGGPYLGRIPVDSAPS